jgi:transposase
MIVERKWRGSYPLVLDTRYPVRDAGRVEGVLETMAMKQYPPEFKADAVALFRSRPGVSIAQVAADLGVNAATLRTWIRADDERRGLVQAERLSSAPVPAPASKSVADRGVEAENAVLRRRVAELEEERDILRKAARYFAGETNW